MNHFTAYPTKPQELAPVCTNISTHVTHGSWNCNLHFDKMHFIFSCVASNRCLRVLISVPRSLLLLTWETDTFLNAYNCLEELTWTLWPFLWWHRFSVGDTWWYEGITALSLIIYFNICITFLIWEEKKNAVQQLLVCLETSGDSFAPLRIPKAYFQ